MGRAAAETQLFSVRFEVNHDVGVNDSSGSGSDHKMVSAGLTV